MTVIFHLTHMSSEKKPLKDGADDEEEEEEGAEVQREADPSQEAQEITQEE